jgi:CIC family chloride channel protein
MSILDTSFPVLQPDDSLRKLTQVVAGTNRNVFPVVKRNGQLIGVLSMGDVRPYLFKTELYDKLAVKDLMQNSVICAEAFFSLHQLLSLLEEHPAIFYVPVVSQGKYVGCVSKSVVLNKYKELVQDIIVQQAPA